MIQSPLRPVVAAGLADDQLTFPWDEWKVREYFDFGDEPLLERLAGVSGRGSMALTMAIGEWVCHRFSRVSADETPWNFIEAGWAGQMRVGRCKYTEIVEDEWRGVARGPLAIVITIANDALFCIDEDPHHAVRPMWMTNLARHVLPAGRDAFESWLAAVIDRLLRLHPADRAADESPEDDAFQLGRPVARELFDTTLDAPSAANEAALVERFLAALDPAHNQFLFP